jgi:putative tricarboxylic transport membrane protein
MGKRGKIFVLGLLLLFSWGTIASADYPEKPIRIIIPFSAGAGNDLTARTFQPFFEKVLGQRVLIDNIPAGSTKVGTMELLKAKPDGYTLILSSNEAWIGYYYSKTYDFKAWEQMTPVGSMTRSPYGFIEVRVESYKTWADLAKAAKENPGKLTCGGPGSGGMSEVLLNEVNRRAGIKTTYVPFAGAAKSGAALYGGHIDFRMCNPVNASPMIKAGKSKGLAISTEKRIQDLPDVPTFKELGIGGTSYLTGGIWGPPKLPANIVKTLTNAIEKATYNPEFMKLIHSRLQFIHYLDNEALKRNMEDFDKEFGALLAAVYK